MNRLSLRNNRLKFKTLYRKVVVVRLKGIHGIRLKLVKKNKSSQHVTGWTWKNTKILTAYAQKSAWDTCVRDLTSKGWILIKLEDERVETITIFHKVDGSLMVTFLFPG